MAAGVGEAYRFRDVLLPHLWIFYFLKGPSMQGDTALGPSLSPQHREEPRTEMGGGRGEKLGPSPFGPRRCQGTEAEAA